MKNKGEKEKTFPCEVCGNPLVRSSRYKRIRCVYCRSMVEVPGFKDRRKKDAGDTQ